MPCRKKILEKYCNVNDKCEKNAAISLTLACTCFRLISIGSCKLSGASHVLLNVHKQGFSGHIAMNSNAVKCIWMLLTDGSVVLPLIPIFVLILCYYPQKTYVVAFVVSMRWGRIR